MGPALDDRTPLQHINAIRPLYRGQAMGDDDGSAAAHQCLQGRLHMYEGLSARLVAEPPLLLGRLGAALGVPARELNLTRLSARLEEEHQDTARLGALRAELRAAVSGVIRTARRLAAVAHYHRGLLDELCATLAGKTDGAKAGGLVDARG